MPTYENDFICLPEQQEYQQAEDLAASLRCQGLEIGNTSIISNIPRICFTKIRDSEGYALDPTLSTLDRQRFNGAISIGEQCFIESHSDRPPFHSQCMKLTCVQTNDNPPGKIMIGNRVHMAGTAIVSYRHVEIGDNVGIGPMVTIMDCDGHTTKGRGNDTEMARLSAQPVKIGSGTGIGAGAWIMKGVTIGKNCMIGANSVVVGDIPDNCVAFGNPARVVQRLKEEEIFA
ncbi:acyltransferase [Thaumasiovibrio subtropicus]|uniref:acyltransferase n=1 Tax=Thaumasiovibrio subtropicus TaxID=1891207 RepID=UPI000B355FF3|nr:acyltransferase [Thaumasiovibrio subtropicus]